MRDLFIFIFILKTTDTFTPVHSAGYLILRNEFRSTQGNRQAEYTSVILHPVDGPLTEYLKHVSQYLAIIRHAMHIL